MVPNIYSTVSGLSIYSRRGQRLPYQEAKSDVCQLYMPPTQAAIPVASEGLAPPAPTRIQLEAEYSQEPEPGRQEQVSKA